LADLGPQRRDRPATWLRRAAPLAIVMAVAIAVGGRSLGRREIDGLDEAQNVMGGMFFVDVLHDLPVVHPLAYGFEYYAQYPALGFAFWPPFFHLVEGLFFAVFGFDLVTGRVCLLAFAMLLAATVYLAARPQTGPVAGVLATALVLATPLVADLQNTMLLEIPTLAMAFLAIVLYRGVARRGRWRGGWEVLLIAIVAAAAVYTKQTIVFIFPAMLVDLWFNQRGLLRDWRTWCCAGLFVLLCVPLALFTLKYGAANVAQSFGNLGNIFVPGHKVSPRWSVAGWTYYGKELFTVVNPVITLAALVGLVYGFFHRPLLRAHALWIGMIVCWYLLFSLFDNKQPRFVAFVAPAVVILAASFATTVAGDSKRLRAAVCGGLTLLLAFQAAAVARQRYEGYSGMDPIVRELFDDLFQNYGEGNIAYFGNYRQMFVPFVRHYDPQRQVYVLQGDDITGEAGGLEEACHDYRVRWILVDLPPQGGLVDPEIERLLKSEACFRLRQRETFGTPRDRVPLLIYEYVDPVADQMKVVPLRSETLNIYVR